MERKERLKLSIWDKLHPDNNPNHILSGENLASHMRWYKLNRVRLRAEHEAKHERWRQEEEARLAKMTAKEIQDEIDEKRVLGI